MMELPEVVACMPRMAGDWQHFSSLLAFVFLAWAFRNVTHSRSARNGAGVRDAGRGSERTSGA